MDKNSITGFILLGILLIAWTYFTAPSPEEIAQKEREAFVQDSIAKAAERGDVVELTEDVEVDAEAEDSNVDAVVRDSILQAKIAGKYGAFSGAAVGTEQETTIENEVMKITFSNKGGKIKEVELKNYKKFELDGTSKPTRVPLKLLEDTKNKMEYILPVEDAKKGQVNTDELYFTVKNEGTAVTFTAKAGVGYFQQRYELKPNDYMLDYNIKLKNLDDVLEEEDISLNWINHLDKLEKNSQYENTYSTLYYRTVDEKAEHLSFTGSDEESVEEKTHWVSNVQQFFNTTLIAKNKFAGVELEVEAVDAESEDLKIYKSTFAIPFEGDATQDFAMQMYLGPNEVDVLESYEIRLDDIIQFGWGLFGVLNRNIIRPLFNFLQGIIGSAGIAILFLTIIIKLLVYPLTFKMLRSQAKMKVLKPQLEKLKAKVGDDQQKIQAEQMKLYQQTGVNPLGGCWPMLLQMPIWFALYRFFPAAIEFRQKGFLWADDLSSYDSIWTFGEVPILSSFYGDHISLFTVLWAITMLIYTYYNSRHLTMPNPTMKYVQYFMPVMFLFFFNNFASGLTCYLLFSNMFNIGQNILTQQFVIDHKALEAELEANKKKPKKQGGFQAKLAKAMEEQQEIARKQQAERERNRKNKNKKK